jgi:hypothetical protein
MESDRASTQEGGEVDDSFSLQAELTSVRQALGASHNNLSSALAKLAAPFNETLSLSLSRLERSLSVIVDLFSQSIRTQLATSRDSCLTWLQRVESASADAAFILTSLRKLLPISNLIPESDRAYWDASNNKLRLLMKQLRAAALPLLGRIAAWLRDKLFRLLSPKEWKIGGKVGTGVFGLAEASLEITFGYDPPPSQSKPAPA